MKKNPNYYLKAVYAAVSAAMGSYVVAVADEHVTQKEWAAIAYAAVLAFGAVYGVSNRRAQ